MAAIDQEDIDLELAADLVVLLNPEIIIAIEAEVNLTVFMDPEILLDPEIVITLDPDG